MKKINEQKRVLIDLIREGKTYTRYEKAREEIAAFPEKKAIADSFREESYLMTVEHRDGAEKVRLLLEKRNSLQSDPIVAEYLQAELDLCRMLQRICMEILNIADLELDSFSDVIRN